jgi:hypothetical protein
LEISGFEKFNLKSRLTKPSRIKRKGSILEILSVLTGDALIKGTGMKVKMKVFSSVGVRSLKQKFLSLIDDFLTFSL